MHKGLYQPHLLFVAMRVLAEAFAGIQTQAFNERTHIGLVHLAAQMAQVLDDLRTAQTRLSKVNSPGK